MDINKIDPQLLGDNLTELLTNSINVSSLFAKVFYSTEPSKTITLSQYVVKDDGSLDIQNVQIKNVAQIQKELIDSVSGSVVQNIGSVIDGETIKLNGENKLYVDGANLSVSAAATATTASSANFAETLKNTLNGNAINVWVGTQADYDAVTVKEANTLYLVKEE